MEKKLVPHLVPQNKVGWVEGEILSNGTLVYISQNTIRYNKMFTAQTLIWTDESAEAKMKIGDIAYEKTTDNIYKIERLGWVFGTHPIIAANSREYNLPLISDEDVKEFVREPYIPVIEMDEVRSTRLKLDCTDGFYTPKLINGCVVRVKEDRELTDGEIIARDFDHAGHINDLIAKQKEQATAISMEDAAMGYSNNPIFKRFDGLYDAFTAGWQSRDAQVECDCVAFMDWVDKHCIKLNDEEAYLTIFKDDDTYYDINGLFKLYQLWNIKKQ